jgi:hypothetical protein
MDCVYLFCESSNVYLYYLWVNVYASGFAHFADTGIMHYVFGRMQEFVKCST